MICYGQEWARKSHQDSAVRFVTAKSGPERATTRHYGLIRPRVGQKGPPRPGSTICYGQEWARKKEPPRPGSTICYGQRWARKSHQDPAVRLVTAESGPERATNTCVTAKSGPERAQARTRKSHQDPAVRFVTAKSGPEIAPRPGSTISYGQERARKSHQDPAVRFVTAKNGPERATKTRQYDLLRPRVGQKEPPRPGSTICYG